ncbi:sulfur carrier protein ThiS adenylyltransferase ThiF [Petralouisia muris]|uniref:Sulfur carrier protein ThiS adenylyltransferase ThiF n=1 Tax=Petralouisia muris TaxID=3032872 RepID=A0AC61S166_9FIRM|nr:sulfur carrier protein ThiS adenylyltransferase ThiF [Petralouisia muris]TGY97939.1 sulfur carrier protein ThiS adenylyltransferase ThiF [Petralouisia muris]
MGREKLFCEYAKTKAASGQGTSPEPEAALESEKKHISRRQLKEALLERYTPEMYEKISGGSAAIAGLGGLGSQIAVMLTRAGVGKLFLVDFDRIELTNLNRQAYDLTHLGREKTEALTEILKKINPYLEVTAVREKVTAENAGRLFQGYPILCEAFDKPGQKAMLVNAVLEQCPHTVVISGNGMAGCSSANTIVTQRKMKRLYLCGDGETDLASGVCLMPSRVMVCAAHQANMAIRLMLGETSG